MDTDTVKVVIGYDSYIAKTYNVPKDSVEKIKEILRTKGKDAAALFVVDNLNAEHDESEDYSDTFEILDFQVG